MRLLLACCLLCGLAVAGISIDAQREANPNTGCQARSSDGDLTVFIPAGADTGSFAVMTVYLDAGAASTPTDWTPVSGNPFDDGTEQMYIFWRFLPEAASNPVTTISGLSGVAGGSIFTLNGVDPDTPIEVVGEDSTATSTVCYGWSINTSTDSAWAVIVCGWGDNGVPTFTKFGGSTTGCFNITAGGSSVGNDMAVSVGGKQFDAAGATGEGSMSMSNVPWVTVVLSIKPAAAAATTVAPGFFFR